MSRELLGDVPFDIHGGGTDLIFPHHENEIAQSEPLMPRTPMANFWVHGGAAALRRQARCRSRSATSNRSRRCSNATIRRRSGWLFLQTGYRKPMNFTEDSIAAANSAVAKLRKAYDAREVATAPASRLGEPRTLLRSARRRHEHGRRPRRALRFALVDRARAVRRCARRARRRRRSSPASRSRSAPTRSAPTGGCTRAGDGCGSTAMPGGVIERVIGAQRGAQGDGLRARRSLAQRAGGRGHRARPTARTDTTWTVGGA